MRAWRPFLLLPASLSCCGIPEPVFYDSDAALPDGGAAETGADAGCTIPEGGACCGNVPCSGPLCGAAGVCSKCMQCASEQTCCTKGGSQNVTCRDAGQGC
jgi:hypothetical protein